ncbi:MAG: hypothetical protein M0Z77_03050 [Thermoplasmatales archaeon]|jgi:hypothetical protein|nr:hypothetical protein [Candidatus Thermoplasmatota archaeon]MCL6002041.1 hypothetical protein [Candidatus Thermoplasmatota archaeon]MDA8054614.1 hypothetical protein [Thermoplasmatales archaeon]
MIDSDASTAKTLTLVAIILQVIFFAIGVISVVGLVAFLSIRRVVTSTGGTTSTTIISSGAMGAFAVLFSIFFLLGLIWILLDYFLVYKKLAEERVREAEVPSLVLGIIQLIFAGVIPGILLIIAYVKIRDSIDRSSNKTAQIPPI